VDARIAALGLLALTACRSGSSPVPEARADDTPNRTGPGVAVVELFTSEGCSSCPPADAVLADLATSGDRSVYALAFHVDYWDDLGWADRFASPAYAARQRSYARALGVRGVYTPQMVVDGTEGLTGSDRGRATAAIARALQRPAAATLALKVRPTGEKALTVDYEAKGAPTGSALNVALVERDASSAVRAGENAGKTLRHVNVVRAFVTMPLTSSTGSVPVPYPAGLRSEDIEAIAYVQRTDGSMAIVGAARATPR
jgi:hypothetical protein